MASRACIWLTSIPSMRVMSPSMTRRDCELSSAISGPGSALTPPHVYFPKVGDETIYTHISGKTLVDAMGCGAGAIANSALYDMLPEGDFIMTMDIMVQVHHYDPFIRTGLQVMPTARHAACKACGLQGISLP